MGVIVIIPQELFLNENHKYVFSFLFFSNAYREQTFLNKYTFHGKLEIFLFFQKYKNQKNS